MNKIAVKLGACALSVCMLSAVFAGCKKDDSPRRREVEATDVTYRDDGTYTTTLNVDGDKIGNIGESDIKVYYSTFDLDAYNAAVQNAQTSAIVPDDFSEVKTAQVNNVTLDGNSLTIDFCDSSASENRTDGYLVLLPDNVTYGVVDVNFAQFTVTPDVDGVLASSSTNKITLELDEGEFISDAPKDVISLRGSFSKMTVESITSVGKNLTLQLTGRPAILAAANSYVDGIIDIDKSAIINAGDDVSVKIPIKEQSAYFISDKLEVSGSNVFVPLQVTDCGTRIDDIEADDITFEAESGINCVSVRKTGDETLLLTLTVSGASDKNAAAEKLNGKTVKINNYEFTASFASASFYPVFDYVDQKGDALEFTLELYAKSGEFVGGLIADEFEFDGDFKQATGVTVKNTGDTTAELKFTVPSQNQTIEDLNMNGTVKIAAGALKNVWGTLTSETVEYTRNYKRDSMGKDLSSGDIDKIKDIVGGFGNTTFGTISAVASGVLSGAEAIMTVLDITGVCPSQASKTLSILEDVQKDVQSLLTLVNKQIDLMREIQGQLFDLALSDFQANIEKLNFYNGVVSGFLENGRQKLKADGKLDDTNLNTKDEAACKNYAKTLIEGIKALESEGMFQGFTSSYETMISAYSSVALAVTSISSNNPMAIYDKYCTTVYNFVHQAYSDRLAQRLNIDYALRSAFANIALWFNFDSTNSLYTGYQGLLAKFEDLTVNITDDSKDDFWVLPGQTASALAEDTNYAVLHGNPDYQYCFVTGDVISNKLNESYANLNGCAIMNGGGNFGYEQETEFIKRMNGRTLSEELALAGIAKCDENTVKNFNSQGLAFRVYAYTDYTEWDFSGLKMIFRKCWYADVFYYNTEDHRASLCTYSYYFDTSAYNEIYCTFACFCKHS